MVYVKRLVMQGFKSFAKRTEIVFDKHINVILGPNGSGKSSSYDTLVTLSSGEEIELGKLVDEQINNSKNIKTIKDGEYVDGDDSIQIITLNKESMKAEKKEISKFIRREGDVLYKIKTRTGKELKATGCHPVMTFINGGVNSSLISELKEGSLIATPRIIEINGKEMDKDYARFIGYIIGDGYIAKDRIEFVNADKEIIEDFIDLTKNKFGLDIRERDDKNIKIIYFRDKKKVKEIRDLFYKDYTETITSEVKQIPKEYMVADNNTISNLLAGLYDTDGSVRKDIAVIEYCTKNQKLAKQIQGLLLRFGITSKVKKRICNAVTKDKRVPGEYYYLYIYGRYNFEKFHGNIHLRAKHKVKNIEMHLKKNVIANPNVDVLPKEINRYVKEVAVLLGIQPKPLRKEYPAFMAYVEDRCSPTREGINHILPLFENKLKLVQEHFKNMSLNQLNLVSFMDEMNLSSPEMATQIGLSKSVIRNRWATQEFNARPENLQKFYNLLRQKYSERFGRICELLSLLRNVANSDIFWDEIVSIEKLDTPKYVYDLTIEDNHNFIANNIFVHNSNVADALCFVLGRLSIKSMRAAKAKNLIFMGSKFIKPSKEAFVEIVFDNTDRSFSLDKDEISIKRGVRVNGQSLYKINEETKTRAEIIELLAQAGIDPHGFNLILQGQIQSIVRMHPEERRKIIEEVAGIAIYESRKEKSIHELEKTDEKLKEINTVLRERFALLRNLEKEKAQAQKFKELELTQKRCKFSILNRRAEDRTKEVNSILKSIETKLKDKEKSVEKRDKSQAFIEQASQKSIEINRHIQQATGIEQDTLHTQIANLKAEIEGLKVRKENYENRRTEFQRRIEEVSKSVPELEQEIEALKKESPSVAKKADELRKKKEELSKLEEEKKSLITLKSELNSIKERIRDRERQLARIQAESDSALKILDRDSRNLIYQTEDECISSVKSLKDSVLEKRTTLNELIRKELEHEKVISLAESDIYRNSEIISKVQKIDVCPLCQSKITESHISHVNSDCNEKISSAESKRESSMKSLSEIKNSRESLVKELKMIEERLSLSELEISRHRSIKDKKDLLRRYVEEEKTLKLDIQKLDERRKTLETKTLDSGRVDEAYQAKMHEIEEISLRNKEDLDNSIQYKERDLEKFNEIIKRSQRDTKDLEKDIDEISKNLSSKVSALNIKEEEEQKLNTRFKKMFLDRDNLQKEIQEKNFELSEIQNEIRAIEDQINYLKIGQAKLDAEIESLKAEMNEYPGVELISAPLQNLEERLKKTQESLMLVGSINLRALEVYDEVKKEYDIVQEKVNTLDKEKQEILKIIEEIDKKKTREFLKAFRAVNELFTQNFAKLYTKGVAFLEIENKEDIFAGGVNIVVKLAKGKYFDVTSLSGGEQTLVALSLLFAIQEHKPYHFYIFDEIDAALDKRNSERLDALLHQYMKGGQYIVITHNDAIIMNSNILYGVSMHEGVSRVLSLRTDDKEAIAAHTDKGHPPAENTQSEVKEENKEETSESNKEE